MMRIRKKPTRLIAVTAIMSFLNACGGSSSGGGNSNSISVETGTFLDSEVAGLNYTTPTRSGITTANGHFNYQVSNGVAEEVTFSIGEDGLVLGAVAGQSTITPLVLIDTEDTNNPEVLKIARILQSVDEDRDPNQNGIFIPSSVREAGNGLRKNIENISDLAADTDINTLLTAAGTTLISEGSALEHIEESLNGATTRVSKNIGSDGGTITSSDGLVTLTISEGALREEVTLSIQEKTLDREGFSGKLYSLKPSTQIFEKSARLAFDNSLLSENNLRINRIRENHQIALNLQENNYSLIAKLGDYALAEALPVANENEAVERFTQSYMASFTELETLTITEGENEFNPYEGQLLGFGPHTLNQGDIITPAHGSFSSAIPEDSEETLGITETTADTTTVDSDDFLFWLDLSAGASEAKESIYVFLDTNTGEFTEYAQRWHPILNGEELYSSIDSVVNATNRIYPSNNLNSASLDLTSNKQIGFSSKYSAQAVNVDFSNAGCERIALLFRTSDEQNFVKSETVMREGLVARLGLANEQIISARPFDKADVLSVFDSLKTYQRNECSCEPFNELLVYFISHGDEGAFVFRGAGVESPKTGKTMGSVELISEMSRICTDKRSAMVESCYSGAIMNEMDKVVPFANLPASRLNREVQNLICYDGDIATATDSKHKSFSSSNFFSDLSQYLSGDYAPFFFSAGLAENFEKDSDDLLALDSTVENFEVGNIFYPIRRQNYQYASYFPAIVRDQAPALECGCDCELDGSTSVEIDNATITEVHVIGESPCRQLLGTFTVTNNGRDPISIERNNTDDDVLEVEYVAADSEDLETAPLDPLQSRTYRVYFNCNDTRDIIGADISLRIKNFETKEDLGFESVTVNLDVQG